VNPDSAVLVKPHLASSISRDGRWVAVVLPFANEDEAGLHFRVYIRDLDGGMRRDWQRLGGEGFALHAPSFSPDSQRLSVLRDTDEGTHVALFELAKPHGPYRVVSELPNATLAYKWFEGPDELCCLGTDADGVRRLWTWRGVHPTPLTPPERAVVDYTIFGRTIAYIYVDDGEEIIVICDDAGEEIRRILGTRAKGRMCYSPDGTKLTFVAPEGPGSLAAEHINLFDLDADGARPEPLGQQCEGVITSFDWHRDGHIVAAYASGTHGKLVELTRGSEPKYMDSARRYLSAPSCARSNDRWIYLEQDNDAPQRLMLVQPGRPAQPLTFFNEGLGATVPGETIEWKSSDGERIQGIWLAPAGEGPHPTVVWLHGGPSEHIGHTFSAYFQVMVGAGYAVFAPNYRGSSGRGPAFAQAAVGRLGELDAADVRSGLEHMIEKGYIHRQKFAFWGWHYGASLALLLCSRDGLAAKVIIAGSPFVDWVAAFGAIADPSPMEKYFVTKWWQDRRPFDLVSPVTYASEIGAPVLLIQGQRDRLLPLSQCMLLYRALKAQDIPTDLVYYVNEGHVLRGADAVRDMLARALQWLDEYLIDEKPELCGG
jgi:dipeptidyl aminopeptidase/acylaminoacyl peptidase